MCANEQTPRSLDGCSLGCTTFPFYAINPKSRHNFLGSVINKYDNQSLSLGYASPHNKNVKKMYLKKPSMTCKTRAINNVKRIQRTNKLRPFPVSKRISKDERGWQRLLSVPR